jgi:ABC-type uncharacterized transport system auxiliary subunit
MRLKREEFSMKNKATMFVATLLVGAFFAGCGATRASHYYHLTVLEGSPSSTDQPQFPVTLLVSPFNASHLYREDRIVYGTQHEQMGTYQFERWSEPPTEMLDEILVRHLRRSGRFREVHSLHSTSRGDYLLRGHLYDLKELASGSGLMARVSFEAELLDSKTKNTLWTHSYTHDEPVGGKDVAAVVSALNRNVQAGVADTTASLEQYFAAHPPAPAVASDN